jgi:hypothetical protein
MSSSYGTWYWYSTTAEQERMRIYTGWGMEVSRDWGMNDQCWHNLLKEQARNKFKKSEPSYLCTANNESCFTVLLCSMYLELPRKIF